MSKQKWQGDAPLGTVLRSYSPPNPVFQTTRGWFFCDEVYADAFGPFTSEDEATRALEKYCSFLETGSPGVPSISAPYQSKD